MQRYRVNYTLLIGLIVGGFICSGAVYGLWRFQVNRNAGNLIERAKEAAEAGSPGKAAGLYQQYLTIRPGDEEALVARARMWNEVARQGDARREELLHTIRVMETTIRELPENQELRRELVDMYMQPKFQMEKDALEHVRIMMQQKPDDAELMVLRARCLTKTDIREAEAYASRLIGFDESERTFDLDEAKTPDKAEIYQILASLLTKQGRSDLADLVMDQLVRVNPESFEALLTRGNYHLANDRPDQAAEDIAKAYDLNPDDAEVLLSKGNVEKVVREYDVATRFLTMGKEKFPQDSRFYQQLADVAMQSLDYETATEFVNEGIEKVNENDSLILLAYKADLQIRASDLEGIKDTIATMRERNFRPDYIQWIEARVLLVQEKWYEASRALNDVRDRMTAFREIHTQIDVYRGLCYEKLGQPELALEAYNFALQNAPKNDPAIIGRNRVRTLIGRSDPDQQAATWQLALSQELQKPKEEQEWDKIDAMMDSIAETKQLTEAGRKLLRAELLLMRKEYDESRRLLQMAYEEEPDQLSVQRAAVRLLRQDPEQGPAKALRFLDERVIQRFGDSPALRAEKADLLMAINDPNLRDQLMELSEGIEEWSPDQQIQLWYALAARFYALNLRDDAKAAWATVADLSPNDLPTRVKLFTMAHDEHDDPAMVAAQERILEVVRDKNDSTYLFTEARRMFSQMRRGQLGEEALPKIQAIVDQALAKRPDWHDLHLLNAELAILRGDQQLALESYGRAAALGRPHPAAVVQHVRLLVARGRFQESKILLERIPVAMRQRLLGQLYAEILFNTESVEPAMQSAQQVIDQDPENALKQLWYGQMMARVAQSTLVSEEMRKDADAKAGAAIARSVELEPKIQEGWLALISYHLMHQNREQAEEALRQAQLALSSERLPIVLAKCYEMMGRWFDAENLYRAAHESAPDNMGTVRQLATFYLGTANPFSNQEKIAKATPLLNKILKAAADGDVPENDPNLVWARRTSAKLLADRGDYQSLLDAEKLLASNSRDGSLALTDRLQMAQILATRPEPISRKKALGLLEEVKEMGRLNLTAELIMGQLYFALGEWPKCRRQMLEVIGRYPDVAAVRERYIRMLLRKDSANQCKRHLEKLMALAPNSPTTLELIARVSAAMNREQQARAALLRALPKDLSEIKDEDLKTLETVAELLAEDLDDEKTALQLYQYLASRDGSKILTLASFLGRHREVEEGFELLDKIYQPQASPAIVQTAIRILRERRDDVADLHDPLVQSWLDRGLRENPDSIPLRMQQAEFLDLQEDYEAAANMYRELLQRKDLRGVSRAIVLNNLSFLLALQGDKADAPEAMRLVREAVSILGPTADILDTRAVVFISQDQFGDAIADLELSLTDNPTASKYFHKAVAHLGAGENTDALDAWNAGLKMGLSRDSVNRLEREQFDRVKSRIEKLQTASTRFNGRESLSAR